MQGPGKFLRINKRSIIKKIHVVKLVGQRLDH